MSYGCSMPPPPLLCFHAIMYMMKYTMIHLVFVGHFAFIPFATYKWIASVSKQSEAYLCY